ncbi:MAG: ABC transporter substrate-binding protein [Candidatus Brocadiae bacterium]|nr:ABC transporter substrate-binding protein [Candidatus Brocadiia bacterium]
MRRAASFRFARAFWFGLLPLGFLLAGCSNDPYPPPGDKKVMYGVLGEDPHGLDPVQAGDTLSHGIISQMYESLFEYHYLERPYALKPCLAESMPEVSADGLVYTIRIKRGVHFQDDACFVATGGKGRELTAGDFVYAIKRLADFANKPRGWWLLQGKVVGLDEFNEESVETAAAGGKMDYDQPVAGLSAPDRYTLQIRLKERYPQLKYALQMSYTAAVPREAVEYYGEDFVNRPVGTGPFRLKEWRKRWKLVLERNPTHRDDFYPDRGEPGDREAGLLDAAGSKLPLVDEVYYTIVSEAQPAWLLFKQGYRDASGISKDNFNQAITPAKELSDEFEAKGIRLTKFPEMVVYYVAFNMKNPVVGTNKKLRQAMSLAYDTEWRIEHFANGRAVSAQGPIPPGMFGYDPELKNPYKQFDPEKARQKLAEAGYPGGIGPDGERLEITYDIGSAVPAARQAALVFAGDMEAIGIKVDIQTNTWAEFLRKNKDGRLQVFGVGWILDYPDPENFLQLLYGPNKAPGPNGSNYDNPEFNRLFERMKAMDDTPERLVIIRKMVDIVVEDAPWIPGTHSVSYTLHHQWVKNVKPHAITGGNLKYRDVDMQLCKRLRRQWNRPNYGAVGVFLAVTACAALLLGALRRGSAVRSAQP